MARGIVVVALVVGALLRSLWPLSDPPERLSWSGGVYTDPSSQTMAARCAAEGWTPTPADRLHRHVFPLNNALTWTAYRLFGVHRQATQWMAAAVATATLAALVFAARRIAGDRAMAIAAVLGALSYWLVMFGRIPLTENCVALVLVASSAFALGPTRKDAAIAGALGTAGVLFGKYHAAPYLLALALFLALRGRRAGAALPAVLGAVPVLLVWLAAVFLPHRAEILSYVGRESMHQGPLPVSLSPVYALVGLVHNVRAAWAFHHAPILGTAGAVAALWIVLRGPARRRALTDGTALFAFWFVLAWTYHALLPYRAPRYFVVLGWPLLACAAVALDRLLGTHRVPLGPLPRRALLAASVCAYVAAFVLVDLLRHYSYLLLLRVRDVVEGGASGLVGALIRVTDGLTELAAQLGWAAGLFVVAALVYVGAIARPQRSPRTLPGRRLAVLLLAAAVLIDAGRFAAWATHRKYVVQEISEDLPGMLGEGAVVMGTFAPLVTLGTAIRPVAILGTMPPGDVLVEQGVTHVLLSSPPDQTELLERYPDLEASTIPERTWALRTRFVRTLELRRLRVPQGTAATYVPTALERAAEAMAEGRWEEAIEHLEEHATARGRSAEVFAKEAACRFQLGDLDQAEQHLHAASMLRPDDPLYLRHLGILAMTMGDAAAARYYWSRASRLEPENPELVAVIRQGLADASTRRR